MYHLRLIGLVLCLVSLTTQAAEKVPFRNRLKAGRLNWPPRRPDILFPTAIVAAPDGTLYIGQDPMDTPGPPTQPIDSVVAFKDGKVRVFADKLWSVMGLEWVHNTLYVVHAPYPLGLSRHRRGRQGGLSRRPHDRAEAQTSRVQRNQRPRPLRRAAGDGRISLSCSG